MNNSNEKFKVEIILSRFGGIKNVIGIAEGWKNFILPKAFETESRDDAEQMYEELCSYMDSCSRSRIEDDIPF